MNKLMPPVKRHFYTMHLEVGKSGLFLSFFDRRDSSILTWQIESLPTTFLEAADEALRFFNLGHHDMSNRDTSFGDPSNQVEGSFFSFYKNPCLSAEGYFFSFCEDRGPNIILYFRLKGQKEYEIELRQQELLTLASKIRRHFS